MYVRFGGPRHGAPNLGDVNTAHAEHVAIRNARDEDFQRWWCAEGHGGECAGISLAYDPQKSPSRWPTLSPAFIINNHLVFFGVLRAILIPDVVKPPQTPPNLLPKFTDKSHVSP